MSLLQEARGRYYNECGSGEDSIVPSDIDTYKDGVYEKVSVALIVKSTQKARLKREVASKRFVKDEKKICLPSIVQVVHYDGTKLYCTMTAIVSLEWSENVIPQLGRSRNSYRSLSILHFNGK